MYLGSKNGSVGVSWIYFCIAMSLLPVVFVSFLADILERICYFMSDNQQHYVHLVAKANQWLDNYIFYVVIIVNLIYIFLKSLEFLKHSDLCKAPRKNTAYFVIYTTSFYVCVLLVLHFCFKTHDTEIFSVMSFLIEFITICTVCFLFMRQYIKLGFKKVDFVFFIQDKIKTKYITRRFIFFIAMMIMLIIFVYIHDDEIIYRIHLYTLISIYILYESYFFYKSFKILTKTA